MARLYWAEKILDGINPPLIPQPPFDVERDSETEIVVHIDEKWFYDRKPRTVWVQKGKPAPAIRVPSKTVPHKVMFLGAVAKPILQHKFDG